jgi:diguanylate cyclase (GGDEF)-like protein
VIRNKARTNGHTKQTAGIDKLTGAWNRPGFIAAANPLFISCQRRESPIALAYFDFHATDESVTADGTVDRILMAMGELLRKAFRASDVIGRIDTLRFAVLLGDCTDEALAAIDGVRALTDATEPQRLTLTAGMVRSAPKGTLEDLMEAADVRTRAIKRDN